MGRELEEVRRRLKYLKPKGKFIVVEEYTSEKTE